ncbi:DUF2087 domain-containing protein [Actinocrinis sp.]|uniref:DUF2087 domain-containing protein n=1 Tax=Actinocrinis sp. TaxID=1920516 RepID=UPI002CDDE8FA|nr:DUF2087 domain-containing protein [Actinocrinis sp.]HXR73396.1 DUF2087 domain-containing protein [Actinocrinis sp.]
MTARGKEEQTPDPRRLIALLADPGRLRVFAALVLAPKQGARPQDLAKSANVPVRDVIKTLIRLDEAGLAVRLTEQPGGPGASKVAAARSGSGTEFGSGSGSGTDTELSIGLNDGDPSDDRWRAVPETLRSATEANTRQADNALPPEPVVRDPGTASLLRGFFARGRLTHVPAAHAKRMVVLDYLAQSFEPGVRYEETKVNRILGKFHDDYAALRRYLVDAGFLSRSENMYWRSGGSVGL